jgi:hypothetical protein
LTVPGGNPVAEVPGFKPRLPLITVDPVLVTVVPARTAKLDAVPKFTAVAARTVLDEPSKRETTSETIDTLLIFFMPFIFVTS